MKLHVTVHIFTHKHMQPDCTELSAEPGGWGKKRYVTGGLSDVWSLKNGSNLRDLCSILVTLLHTHTHTLTHTFTHACTHWHRWDGKQVGSARLLAAIMTAQVVKTNGWTELCIHMDIIYISNMYIYTVQWRERQREKLTSTYHLLSSLFLVHSLCFFILLRTNSFPKSPLKAHLSLFPSCSPMI